MERIVFSEKEAPKPLEGSQGVVLSGDDRLLVVAGCGGPFRNCYSDSHVLSVKTAAKEFSWNWKKTKKFGFVSGMSKDAIFSPRFGLSATLIPLGTKFHDIPGAKAPTRDIQEILLFGGCTKRDNCPIMIYLKHVFVLVRHQTVVLQTVSRKVEFAMQRGCVSAKMKKKSTWPDCVAQKVSMRERMRKHVMNTPSFFSSFFA